ncbi:hypothetical protein ES705_38611 [subsurface metagenome]
MTKMDSYLYLEPYVYLNIINDSLLLLMYGLTIPFKQ